MHESGDRLDAGGDKFGVLVGQALGGGPFADDLAGGGAPAFDARLPREAAGTVREGSGEGVGFGEEIQPVDRFADTCDEARGELRDEQPVGVLARDTAGVGDAVLAREPAAEAVLGGCHGSVQAERTPARRMASKARAPSPGWRSTARNGVDEDEGGEAAIGGVESGVEDAVVRRKATDDDRTDATFAEDGLKERAGRVAAGGVADGEAGVAVLAAGSLAHDLAHDAEVGVEFGAPGVLDAVDGPDASILLEVRSVGWVPVLRVDDASAGGLSGSDSVVEGRDDLVAATHGEAAAGVGEVVLDIDDDEGGVLIPADHAGPPWGGAEHASSTRQWGALVGSRT